MPLSHTEWPSRIVAQEISRQAWCYLGQIAENVRQYLTNKRVDMKAALLSDLGSSLPPHSLSALTTADVYIATGASMKSPHDPLTPISPSSYHLTHAPDQFKREYFANFPAPPPDPNA